MWWYTWIWIFCCFACVRKDTWAYLIPNRDSLVAKITSKKDIFNQHQSIYPRMFWLSRCWEALTRGTGGTQVRKNLTGRWSWRGKGRVASPNGMNYWKKGRGVIFNPNYVADFGPLNRAFGAWNWYKFATWYSENEGEGSKAVWNFSENSSVLVALPIPNRDDGAIFKPPGPWARVKTWKSYS